jgi:5-methylthioadenosine/S-adenosylhomocysteine deaminase
VARYIVRGDAVVTMDAASMVVRRGAVIVDGPRIEAVGPDEELSRRGPFERELGGPGFVLMPGMVSAHNHTAVVLKRDYGSMAFERREPVTMYSGAWTEEDLYWLNLYMNVQLLKGGNTGVITIYYGLKDQPDLGAEPVARSFIDAGIRCGLGIAARDRWDVVHVREPTEFLKRLPPDIATRVEASDFGYRYDTEQIEVISRRLAARYNDGDRLFRMFACADWTPSSTDELYGRVKRLAKELDTGVVTHLLETPYEALHSFRTYGKSAVRRLVDIGFLGPEVTGTDCVWVTEDDLTIMAEAGNTAVFTPWHITGFSGIAPVRQMLAAGVRVAFSIMLRSQNDGYDTLSDLAIGEHLQHLPGITAGALPADQWLRLATVNAAHALTLDDSLGSLEAGKRADLLLVSTRRLYDDAFLDPDCDLHKLLIYRGRADEIDTVIVNGRAVVEGGRCLTVNEEEAFERARRGALRITSDRAGIQKWLDLAAELDPYIVKYYEGWDLPRAVTPWNAYNARSIRA